MMLLEDVSNVKYTYKFDEVPMSIRKHKGNKVVAKGALDVGVSFTLPNIKPRSAAAALVYQALHSRRMPIAICMLDEAGGEGPFGDFEILGGDKNEEQESAQEIEVEAKPAAVGRKVEWFTAPQTGG